MIRKIVAQGKGANTLTLPAEWIKLNNLKPGDEVAIIKKNNDLIITTSRKNEAPVKSIEINVEGNKILLTALLNVCYRKGYDEVYVVIHDDNEVSTIKDKVARMIGYEIMESKEGKMVIKRVASASIEEYNNSVKRACFTLKAMLDTLNIGLKEKNKKRLLEVIEMDANLDKLTDYGRHILLKDSSVDPSNAPNSYLFLWSMEKIGDLVRDIAKIYSNSKQKIKIDSDIESLNEQVMSLASQFYDLAFALDNAKIPEFFSKRAALEVKIFAVISNSSKEKARHAHYLESIVRMLLDSFGQIVMSNL